MKRKRKIIPVDKWKWHGMAGHFICGDGCLFHMTTQIGRYLISTVGHYLPRGKASKETERDLEHAETIGCERKFETMVFKRKGRCQCGCGLPEHDGSDIDFEGYNDYASATKGHMRLCLRYAGLE